MRLGLDQQKKAVAAGYWPLYRYNPALAKEGKTPFLLDSKPPSTTLDKFAYNEGRYRMLTQSDPDEAARLLKLAQDDVGARWKQYEKWAGIKNDA